MKSLYPKNVIFVIYTIELGNPLALLKKKKIFEIFENFQGSILRKNGHF